MPLCSHLFPTTHVITSHPVLTMLLFLGSLIVLLSQDVLLPSSAGYTSSSAHIPPLALHCPCTLTLLSSSLRMQRLAVCFSLFHEVLKHSVGWLFRDAIGTCPAEQEAEPDPEIAKMQVPSYMIRLADRPLREAEYLYSTLVI